jgi:hypothetical protein
MDQRSICLFLATKELWAHAIHNELVSVLGPDAIAYSNVTKDLHPRQCPLVPFHASDERSTTVIDNVILDALGKQPFSSICELAKLTCIPTATVHRQLTRSLGFVVKHLSWVLHSLTDTQEAQRLTLPN